MRLSRMRTRLFFAIVVIAISFVASYAHDIDGYDFSYGAGDHEKWTFHLYVNNPAIIDGKPWYTGNNVDAGLYWRETGGLPDWWDFYLQGVHLGHADPQGSSGFDPITQEGTFGLNVGLSEGDNTISGYMRFFNGATTKTVTGHVYRDSTGPAMTSVAFNTGDVLIDSNGTMWVTPGSDNVIGMLLAASDGGVGVNNQSGFLGTITGPKSFSFSNQPGTAVGVAAVNVAGYSDLKTYTLTVRAKDRLDNTSGASALNFIMDSGLSQGGITSTILSANFAPIILTTSGGQSYTDPDNVKVSGTFKVHRGDSYWFFHNFTDGGLQIGYVNGTTFVPFSSPVQISRIGSTAFDATGERNYSFSGTAPRNAVTGLPNGTQSLPLQVRQNGILYALKQPATISIPGYYPKINSAPLTSAWVATDGGTTKVTYFSVVPVQSSVSGAYGPSTVLLNPTIPYGLSAFKNGVTSAASIIDLVSGGATLLGTQADQNSLLAGNAVDFLYQFPAGSNPASSGSVAGRLMSQLGIKTLYANGTQDYDLNPNISPSPAGKMLQLPSGATDGARKAFNVKPALNNVRYLLTTLDGQVAQTNLTGQVSYSYAASQNQIAKTVSTSNTAVPVVFWSGSQQSPLKLEFQFVQPQTSSAATLALLPSLSFSPYRINPAVTASAVSSISDPEGDQVNLALTQLLVDTETGTLSQQLDSVAGRQQILTGTFPYSAVTALPATASYLSAASGVYSFNLSQYLIDRGRVVQGTNDGVPIGFNLVATETLKNVYQAPENDSTYEIDVTNAAPFILVPDGTSPQLTSGTNANMVYADYADKWTNPTTNPRALNQDSLTNKNKVRLQIFANDSGSGIRRIVVFNSTPGQANPSPGSFAEISMSGTDDGVPRLPIYDLNAPAILDNKGDVGSFFNTESAKPQGAGFAVGQGVSFTFRSDAVHQNVQLKNLNWYLAGSDLNPVNGPRVVNIWIYDQAGNVTKTSYSTGIDTGNVSLSRIRVTPSYVTEAIAEYGSFSASWKFDLSSDVTDVMNPGSPASIDVLIPRTRLIALAGGDNVSDADGGSTDSGTIARLGHFDQNRGAWIGAEIDADTDHYLPNTPVATELQFFDRAMNQYVLNAESSPAFNGLYSLATNGVLTSVSPEVATDKLPGGEPVYSLTWKLANPGAASQELIRISNVTGGSGNWGDGHNQDAVFTSSVAQQQISGFLYPRGTINYSLVAVNKSGQETVMVLPAFPIRNQVPLSPVVAAPVVHGTASYLGSDTSSISWQRSDDPEGDQLVYHLFAQLGAGNWDDDWKSRSVELVVSHDLSGLSQSRYVTENNVLQWKDLRDLNDGTGGNPDHSEFFYNGASFSWLVEADDQQTANTGFAISTPQNSVIDLDAPAMSISGRIVSGGTIYTGGPSGSSATVTVTVTKTSPTFGIGNSAQTVAWQLVPANGIASGTISGTIALAAAGTNTYSGILDFSDAGLYPAGSYIFVSNTEDWAGHIATVANPPAVVVDHDLPGVSVSSQSVAYTASNTPKLAFTATDQSSGVARIQYQLLSSPSGTLGMTAWRDLTGTGFGTESRTVERIFSDFSHYADGSAIVDGSNVYVAVRGVDQVGNVSPARLWTKWIYFDRRVPTVDTVTLRPETAASASTFIPGLSGLRNGTLLVDKTIRANGTDSNTNTILYGLAAEENPDILPAAGNQNGWKTDVEDLDTIPVPAQGGRYEVVVQVVTIAGAVSRQNRSQVFVIDDRSPYDAEVLRAPDTGLGSGDSAYVRFKVSTNGSPLHSAQIWLENASGQRVTAVSGQGWSNGVYTVLGDQAGTPAASVTIPDELAAGQYRFAVQATDVAGHVSVAFKPVEASFTVDRTAHLVVQDGGSFTALAEDGSGTFRGMWHPVGNLEIVSWSYELMTSVNGNVTSATGPIVGTANQYNLSAGLGGGNTVPVAGQRYWWRVSARLSDNTVVTGQSPQSPGMRVDGTPPVFALLGGVTQAVPSFIKSLSIPVSFKISDPESGTVRADIKLYGWETTGGETKLVPLSSWVQIIGTDDGSGGSLFNATPATISLSDGISLSGGQQLVVKVRIENRAGMFTDVLLGNPIWSTDGPPVPVVNDGGGYFNPFPHGVNSQTQLPWPGTHYSANWAASIPDSVSGSSYQWAIVKDPLAAQQYPERIDWQNSESSAWTVDVTNADSVETGAMFGSFGPFSDAEAVYLAVRATNGVGLSSIGVSGGKIVDSLTPSQPIVFLQYKNGSAPVFLDQAKPMELAAITNDEGSGVATVVTRLHAVISGTDATLGNELPMSIDPLDGQYKADIPAGLIANLPDNTVLYAVVDATDATGNVRTGRNPGSVLEHAAASVDTANIAVDSNGIHVSWNLLPESAYALSSFAVRILRADASNPAGALQVYQKSVGSAERNLTLMPGDLNLTDGWYLADVQPVSRAFNTGTRVASAMVPIDRSAAVFVASGTAVPRFADMKLGFNLLASDDMSRIVEYQYAIGTFTNPQAFKTAWSSTVVSGTDTFAGSIPFNTLDTVPSHGEATYLYYRVLNSSGIWSAVKQSDVIEIDHTAPVVENFTTRKYATIATMAEDSALSAHDPESSITAYRYLPVGQTETVSDLANGTLVAQTGNDDGVLAIGDLDIQVPSKIDGSVYRIAMQVRNGAGTWSEISYSAPVTVDILQPSLTFTYADPTWNTYSEPLIDHPFDDNARQIVTNTGEIATIPYYMDADVAEMTFKLANPVSGSIESTRYSRPAGADGYPDMSKPFYPVKDDLSLDLTAPANIPVYHFSKAAQAYGTYELGVRLVDKAGWVTVYNPGDPVLLSMQHQSVRINAPAEFGNFILQTTPGRPHSMTLSGFGDPDGDSKTLTITMNYSGGTIGPVIWHKYDAQGNLNAPVIEVEHPFYQANDQVAQYFPERTTYDVTFSIQDSRSRNSAPEVRTEEVTNTMSGPLYTDEYWGGEDIHLLQGMVTVGSGLKLTILPDYDVLVSSPEATPTDNDETPIADIGLVIAGTLVTKTGAALLNPNTGLFWRGIYVNTNGLIQLDGTAIQNADRALAIETPRTDDIVLGLAVDGGNIGLHLMSGTLPIDEAVFSNLYGYGIKTEEGALVQSRNGRFVDTEFIYYESDRTILTLAEMNALDGSSGNTATGQ